MASVGPPSDTGVGGGSHRSPPHTSQQQQGQAFQPMDKASSQTVKLNPILELSHTELQKLLSYMEAELQARDVVIATLKTERIKSLLAYGRGGIHDPVLALQRDTACAVPGQSGGAAGDAAGGAGGSGGGAGAAVGDPQSQMRGLQDTQLTQLEHLITQQRKAHQRMRHVLREAEKRHSRVVGELEEERRKHEHDTAQGDDVTYALERDRARLKQSIDSERALRRTAEAECARLTAEREEQRSRHKQMVLLLLEDRNRLAAQTAHHKHRADELAKVVSEEKGRVDGMAEGLEEESKKSLQMEAELEKQLAHFDTERQQMRALLQRRDDRVEELESQVEKLQRDVSHYQKQLQEAHNVAMFQQTLSVSPPRHVSPQTMTLPAASRGGDTLSHPPPSAVSSSVVTGVSISQAPNIIAIPSLGQQQQAAAGLITSAGVVNISNISSVGSMTTARLPLSSVSAGSKTATLPSGLGGSRPQPPQLPAKPPQLSHQTRLPGTLPPPKVSARVRASSPGIEEPPPLSSQSSPSSSHVVGGAVAPTAASSSSYSSPTPLSYSYSSSPEAGGVVGGASKAVQLTATINSVPVTLPTTGIARGVQPARAVLYQPTPPCGGEGCEVLSSGASQVVQLSPRVNVSATGTGKVITSSQGGKFTFQVSTTSPASQHGANYINQSTQLQQQQQQQQPPPPSVLHQQVLAPPTSRKPLPPARSATTATANNSAAPGAGGGGGLPATAATTAAVNNNASHASPATNNISRGVAVGGGGSPGVAVVAAAAANNNTALASPVTNSTRAAASHAGAPPPLPPNKPLLSATATTTAASSIKKEAPISVKLKPHKLGPQTLKFGITISKSSGAMNPPPTTAGTGVAGQQQIGGAGEVDAPVLIDTRRDISQVTQTS